MHTDMFPLPVYNPTLGVPAYKTGQIGPWLLGFSGDMPATGDAPWHDRYIYGRGYSTGLGLEPHYHFLLRDDPETGERVAWMNTSRREQESHVVHIGAAHGNVVIVGGGMGMVLKAVAAKPEVTSVLLIEQDPLILELIRERTDFQSWEGAGKIDFLLADALGPDLGKLVDGAGLAGQYRRGALDFLYVDIWSDLGSERDWTDTRQIQAQLGAKLVGFWGQELHFIAFCHEVGISPQTIDLAAWDAYQSFMGMKLPERSVGYLWHCLKAARVMAQAHIDKHGV